MDEPAMPSFSDTFLHLEDKPQTQRQLHFRYCVPELWGTCKNTFISAVLLTFSCFYAIPFSTSIWKRHFQEFHYSIGKPSVLELNYIPRTIINLSVMRFPGTISKLLLLMGFWNGMVLVSLQQIVLKYSSLGNNCLGSPQVYIPY